MKVVTQHAIARVAVVSALMKTNAYLACLPTFFKIIIVFFNVKPGTLKNSENAYSVNTTVIHVIIMNVFHAPTDTGNSEIYA